MRIVNTVGGSALAASAAIILLAGCAGFGLQRPISSEQMSHSGVPPAQTQVMQSRMFTNVPGAQRAIGTGRPTRMSSFMSPDAVGKPLIFVADGYATVNIYLQDRRHRLVGWITGLNYPLGIATDVAGNLYIANSAEFGGTPSVLVYAPPYTSGPKLTLENVSPFGVSVSTKGVVAVTGCTTSSGCGLGVTFYAKDSTVPCAAVVTNPPMVPNYGAFDDKGNLFITGGNTSNGGLVGEIAGGCSANSMTPLVTGNTISSAAGIQIDRADRIAILDFNANAVIDTYLQPKNGSLGNPASTTPLTSSPFAPTFTFLESGRGIWVADGNGWASSYDYPTGGASEQTIIGGGFPYGIAVTPPLLP